MPKFETGHKGEGGDKVFFLEPGKYRYKVVDASERKSRNGDPQFMMKLKVSDGTNVVDATEFLTFSDAAYWNVEEFLRSIGRYPGDNVGVDLEPEMIIGAKGLANFKVRDREYEGKVYKSSQVDSWVQAEKQVPWAGTEGDDFDD
jgi:hypothetical protein